VSSEGRQQRQLHSPLVAARSRTSDNQGSNLTMGNKLGCLKKNEPEEKVDDTSHAGSVLARVNQLEKKAEASTEPGSPDKKKLKKQS